MQPAFPTTCHHPGDFKAAFKRLVPDALLSSTTRREGRRRRPPKLRIGELLMSLVFHCLQDSGTLAGNLRILFRKRFAESTVSQRRQNLPWKVFTALMEAALAPKATPQKHGQAFYKGWRLVAIDGTQFSVSNTPQILGSLSKAASRRMKAAFAKVGVVLLGELGVHNPLPAPIDKKVE